MLNSGEILAILQRVRELGYRRFRLESADLDLEVDEESSGNAARERDRSRSPAAANVSEQPARAEPRTDSELVAIRAPMSGTFYRASAPNAAPFVDVGQHVAASDTVCIIEVMKLFNTIMAGVVGTVIEIVAENEQPVTTGQPVIWIRPDSE